MKQAKRTALITGSGKNIGRGIAHELAQAGHNIVVNGISDREAAETVVREINELGADGIVSMGNIGIKKEAESLVERSTAAFGSLDIVINNAAIRPHGPFLDVADTLAKRYRC